MRPERLDHVALYVPEPEETAARLLAQLPFRILEQTDEFVLVGRAPERGKLTLFRADGPTEAGVLGRIALGIPCGTLERTLDLGDLELEVALVPAASDGDVDLASVALLTEDPERAAREWTALGFRPAPAAAANVARVRLGDVHLELHEGRAVATDRPLLNHLGLLVESLEDVDRDRLDVIRTVDAESSRALFVHGPGGVEVEYIEHKPSFALA